MKKEFSLFIEVIDVEIEDVIKTSTTLEEMNEEDIKNGMVEG